MKVKALSVFIYVVCYCHQLSANGLFGNITNKGRNDDTKCL